MTTAQRRYPLGTDRVELERLHLQHQLWSDAAHALWRRAAIGPGSRVLDVGAGPGAASLDLAQLVTASGRVLAVDESAGFVDFLTAEASARGLQQLTAQVADVQALENAAGAEPGSFDAAYARWVLCFLPRPEAAVRGAARLLRKGGVLCVHDYFNYTSMTPAPRRKSYDEVVAATARSWLQNGGDPDVVGRLPALLHEAGFELEHLEVHQRVARPGDQMWHWTLTWWRSYTPKLVAMGLLTEAQERTFHDDVAQMTRERDFISLPPVYEVMARKR
jgi:ubiquinone/menaquinone biosynthesis C-methylase UbiE